MRNIRVSTQYFKSRILNDDVEGFALRWISVDFQLELVSQLIEVGGIVEVTGMVGEPQHGYFQTSRVRSRQTVQRLLSNTYPLFIVDITHVGQSESHSLSYKVHSHILSAQIPMSRDVLPVVPSCRPTFSLSCQSMMDIKRATIRSSEVTTQRLAILLPFIFGDTTHP